MKTVLKKILLTLSLGIVSIGSSVAADVNGNFQATSILNGICTVSSTDISFGQYQGVQKDVNGSFTALCSKGIPYVVTISSGQSGNVLNRRLKGSISENTDELSYQIYNNASRTAIWAAQEGQSGSNAMGYSGIGSDDTRIIYARLNAGNQYVLPDNYSDLLILTVTY